MADTTRLAGTFEAWRLTIGVKSHYLEDALKHCKGLGLDPRVCGYQEEVGILFSIVVPSCVCKHPEPHFMAKEMRPFHGALVHAVKVQLICPLPAEPKTE